MNSIITPFVRAFPQHEINIAKEKRQYSCSNCDDFARDDVKQSYVFEQRRGPIWDYLALIAPKAEHLTFKMLYDEEHKGDEKGDLQPPMSPMPEMPPIRQFSLPAIFLKNTQSTESLNSYIDALDPNEQAQPVNRAAECLATVKARFFRANPVNEGKIQNMRIVDKRQLWDQYTWEYFRDNPWECMVKEKEWFTLKGFMQRHHLNAVHLNEENNPDEFSGEEDSLSQADEKVGLGSSF